MKQWIIHCFLKVYFCTNLITVKWIIVVIFLLQRQQIIYAVKCHNFFFYIFIYFYIINVFGLHSCWITGDCSILFHLSVRVDTFQILCIQFFSKLRPMCYLDSLILCLISKSYIFQQFTRSKWKCTAAVIGVFFHVNVTKLGKNPLDNQKLHQCCRKVYVFNCFDVKSTCLYGFVVCGQLCNWVK